MLLIVLALVSSAFAAGPLKDTGHIQWRDCSAGNPWVKVNNFDITPKPIKVPGDMKVTLHGTITHHLAHSVNLNVLMEKELLGRYTKVPCKADVGTCQYDDPCHFLNAFKQQGSCPAQLTAHGLPCTCPFNPSKLDLPASSFTVTEISDAWKFLANGKYHIKVQMNEKSTGQERACFEAYINISL